MTKQFLKKLLKNKPISLILETDNYSQEFLINNIKDFENFSSKLFMINMLNGYSKIILKNKI